MKNHPPSHLINHPLNPDSTHQLAKWCGPSLSRREALQRILWGAGGLLLCNQFVNLRALAGESAALPGVGASKPSLPKPKAKSVIQIWLAGGPPHIDLFDPKPDAGPEYNYGMKGLDTNIPGIRIGDGLKGWVKQADKFSIIRGMTHGIYAHETATYLTQTGWPPGTEISYPFSGVVVSFLKGYDAGYKGALPPLIELTGSQKRYSEVGCLPMKYAPFATGGDPGKIPFEVEGIVAPGITPQRQQNRRELLRKLDTLQDTIKTDPQMALRGLSIESAYNLILGDGAKAFDISSEKQETRDLYKNVKGQFRSFNASCLIARRLVEEGVPYIVVNDDGGANGQWDWHTGNFGAYADKCWHDMYAIAGLLQDLSDRGLLCTTIVVVGGEFGRTPKIDFGPSSGGGGRSHWGSAYSVVVAGGGFKGGQIVGATDAHGEYVKDRPVSPTDLIGSIYELMGIDPDALLPNPKGLTTHVMPRPSEAKQYGLLREIM